MSRTIQRVKFKKRDLLNTILNEGKPIPSRIYNNTVSGSLTIGCVDDSAGNVVSGELCLFAGLHRLVGYRLTDHADVEGGTY